MYHDFCRREREAQDVGDGGVDVARRLGAEEGAHEKRAAGVRLRPARREGEGECQGLGHILSLYQHLCLIGVAGSWMPIVSSVA